MSFGKNANRENGYRRRERESRRMCDWTEAISDELIDWSVDVWEDRSDDRWWSDTTDDSDPKHRDGSTYSSWLDWRVRVRSYDLLSISTSLVDLREIHNCKSPDANHHRNFQSRWHIDWTLLSLPGASNESVFSTVSTVHLYVSPCRSIVEHCVENPSMSDLEGIPEQWSDGYSTRPVPNYCNHRSSVE